MNKQSEEKELLNEFYKKINNHCKRFSVQLQNLVHMQAQEVEESVNEFKKISEKLVKINPDYKSKLNSSMGIFMDTGDNIFDSIEDISLAWIGLPANLNEDKEL